MTRTQKTVFILVAIVLELGRRIAMRIDADQDHLQLIHNVLGQLALDLTQLGEGGWARSCLGCCSASS